MDTVAKFNDAISYIEANLAGDIDNKEAARRALCSEYHFQRMFAFLAGVTPSEYIRRRRMTLAAFELQNSEVRVLDVAVKYGYSSADAFSRAFHSMHGVTPSEARKQGQALKSYPVISFKMSIKGGRPMQYRIEEKEAFRIVGIMKRVPIVFEGVNPEIAAIWASLNDATITRLKALSNTDPAGIISASINFSEGRMEEKGGLDHYIGVATTQESPDDLETLEVGPSVWAVFTAVGPFPETLQNVWGAIYSEWFPTSNYEQSPGPEILWNRDKDVSSPDFQSEIWIPVTRRWSI